MSKSWTKNVTLILGPTSSGKTARALSLYREAKCASNSAAVIFLVPTSRTAEAVKERLLIGGQLEVLAAPRIFTFPQLVRSIITATGSYAPEAPPPILSAMIRRISAKLAREGELQELARAQQFPGFIRALSGLIAELKLAAVIPEVFGQAVLARRARPMDRLVALLYQAYQDELLGKHLFDRAGLSWQAQDSLITKGLGGLEETELLIVDGFSSFFPVELNLLELMASRIPRVLITLPYEKDGAREELYEAPGCTREELRHRLSPVEETLAPMPAQTPLNLLERHLFEPRTGGATQPPVEVPGQEACPIFLLEAPGRRAEVEEVARRIKQLIVEEGHPPDDIVLLFRSLGDYQEIVRQVFSDMGIPFHVSRGRPFLSSPVVQSVLALMALKVNGFPRDAVSAFAGNSFFSLTEEGGSERSAPAALEALAVEAGIIKGKEQWLRRLGTYAKVLDGRCQQEQAEEKRQVLTRKRREVEEAKQWVQRLFSLLDKVPDEDSPEQLGTALKKLLGKLHFHEHILETSQANRLAEELKAAQELDKLIDITVRSLELSGLKSCRFSELVSELRWALSEVELRVNVKTCGRVSVMEMHEARSLSFPIVFIAGLAEGTFPRPAPPCPFYGDEERRRLKRLGVPLQERKLSASQERFLFYQAVTRAREQLYLSRPTADADGRPVLASAFWEETVQLLERLGIEHSRIKLTLSSLMPDISRASSVPELRRAVTAKTRASFGADLTDVAALSRWLKDRNPELSDNVGAGIEQEELRSSARPGEFMGAITEASAREEIAKEFSSPYLYSVGQLNDYASCPFRFFCQHLLKLEPLTEIEEELSPRDLGEFYHRILFQFYRSLHRERGGNTVLRPEDADEMKARLGDLVRETFRQGAGYKPALKSFLVAIQEEQVIEVLARFIDAEIASPFRGPRLPAYFEVAFGIIRDASMCDKISTSSPLVIGSGKDAIRIAGKVDRIDMVPPASEGEVNGYCIIDYKTGANVPSAGDVGAGKDVQLPLYALAAREVLLAHGDIQLADGYFLSFADMKPKCQLSKVAERKGETLEELLALITDAVKGSVAGIRKGRFPPLAEGRDCPRYCDFRLICRHGRPFGEGGSAS